MAIQRSTRAIGETRMRAVARRLLGASTLCAIATVTPGGRAHINTAYFAWSPELRLVWLSEPRSGHSRNLRTNASAAIAVYDSTQSWGKPDSGIQLFGSGRELVGPQAQAAEKIYARRFPDHRRSDLSAYRYCEFRPRRLKLFDEGLLGAGTFVTASVGAGGRLRWERTEIYDPSS